MSDFFPCPPPPREWTIPPEPTAAELYRRRLEREHGAEVDRLLANSSELAGFVAGLRLLARAGSSPASGSAEPHIDAGGLGTAEVPGPACTCGATCPLACKGECGCRHCHDSYQDFLADDRA